MESKWNLENARMQEIWDQYAEWRIQVIENENRNLDIQEATRRMRLYGSAISNHLPVLPNSIWDALVEELSISDNKNLEEQVRIDAVDRATDMIEILLTKNTSEGREF